MSIEEKIPLINKVVADYFKNNPSVDKIQAKELMPQFIDAGVFNSNQRDGLPIRKLLRTLNEDKRLGEIPQVLGVKKNVNTNWFFLKAAPVEQIVKE